MAEIEPAIPSALQDEAKLMRSLAGDNRTKSTISSEVSPVVRFMTEKVDMLADFANVYTHSADFDEKEITVDGRATHWQGLWAHYSGHSKNRATDLYQNQYRKTGGRHSPSTGNMEVTILQL